MWDKLRIVNNVGGHDSWGMAKEVSVISFLSMYTIDKIKTNSNLPVCRRNLYLEVQWMTLGHILVSHSVRKIFSHECRRKWQNKRVALGKCSKTCSGLRKSKMSFISFFYLHFRASVQSKIQLATATSGLRIAHTLTRGARHRWRDFGTSLDSLKWILRFCYFDFELCKILKPSFTWPA